MILCKNCGNPFEGNYCNSCGQTAKTQRLNWHFIIDNIEHDVLHFDHGIIYTIRQIFIRPGETIKKFIAGQRKKYTHPLTYLVVISVVYYIFRSLLVPHENAVDTSDVDKTIADFIYNYYSKIVMVIIIPLAALYTPIFYPGEPYNFVELFTFHCYIRGQFMIFELIVIILNWLLVKSSVLLPSAALITVNIVFNVFFLCWALKQFFNEKNFGFSFLKAVALMIMLIMSAIMLTKVAALILGGK